MDPVTSNRSNSLRDCKGGEIRIPDCESFRLSLPNTRLNPLGGLEIGSEGACGDGCGCCGLTMKGLADCDGCGGGNEN